MVKNLQGLCCERTLGGGNFRTKPASFHIFTPYSCVEFKVLIELLVIFSAYMVMCRSKAATGPHYEAAAVGAAAAAHQPHHRSTPETIEPSHFVQQLIDYF